MDQKTRFVAYYRMPAAGGRAAIWPLERQKRAISAWLDGVGHDLVGEFTEVRHAMAGDALPPALDLALDCCRSLDATLIAAVTETAIGAETVEAARREGIAILLVDASDGDPVSDGRQKIEAEETPYLALRGSARPPVPLRGAPPRRTPAGNRAKADRFARAILPIIDQIRATGATTLSDIADQLNARRVRTARGRRWYPTTVRNILNRRPGDAAD